MRFWTLALQVTVIALGACFAGSALRAETCEFTDEIRAPEGMPSRHFGYDLSFSGDTLVVKSLNDDPDGPSQATYVFRDVNTDWELEMAFADGAFLVADIEAWGDFVAIGDADLDAVRIYRRIDGTWELDYVITAEDFPGQDWFVTGYSFSLNGERIAISARQAGREPSVAIFERGSDGWVFSTDVNYTEETGEGFYGFGYVIELSGDLLAITGYWDFGYAPPVDVALYRFDGTEWDFEAHLPDPEDHDTEFPPFDIAVSGEQVAYLDGGPIKVWKKSDQGWILHLAENPDSGTPDPAEIYSLAIEGDRLVAGQPMDSVFSSDNGALIDYHPNGEEWLPHQKWVESPTLFRDVGASVELAGGRAIVSMRVEDGNEAPEGLIRLYECTVSRGDDDCGTSGLYVNAGILGCMPRDYLQPRTGRVPLRR